jgi:hypothetical protein
VEPSNIICPCEALEIEQCPAFLEPGKAEFFPCPHKKDCESEIVDELGDLKDLVLAWDDS